MTKGKKALIIAGVVVDLLITTFLFVISVIMVAKLSSFADKSELDNFIQTTDHGIIVWFLRDNTRFLLLIVIPLFILLAINIIAVIIYTKKSNTKNLTVSDLSEEQKQALKKQLMEEIDKK